MKFILGFASGFLFLFLGWSIAFGSSFTFIDDSFSDVKNPLITTNTYETICRGTYTIDKTNPQFITSVGFGDLAGQYTYEIISSRFSSSTVPVF